MKIYSLLHRLAATTAIACVILSPCLGIAKSKDDKTKKKDTASTQAKAPRTIKSPKNAASKFNSEADITRQLNDTPPPSPKAPAPSPTSSTTTTTTTTTPAPAPAPAPKAFSVDGSGYKGEGKVDGTGKILVTLIGTDGKPFNVTLTPKN